jgi:predicted CXXCH cytochrome family protein
MRIVTSASPSAPAAEPTDAEAKTHVCARCHQVLFSRYPWTWEGGRRHENAGGSHISSGEARDFLLGGCAGAMTCTACHDPHAADGSAKLHEVDSLAGNAICLRCHDKYRGDDALRAHAHHDPRGDGGVCIRCHMAKKNMTLDSTLGRYHRIGSPSDPVRVLRDRPLECALCHTTKSTESLVVTMEAWWSKKYDRALLRELYGDLSRPNLLPTLASGKPHEQAVALALLPSPARTLDAPTLALVQQQMANEYPLVREYAKACLARAGIAATDVATATPADADTDPGED